MRLRSLFLVLRRSPAEVIAVIEVIGYRSRPMKRAMRIDSKVSDLRSSTQCGSAGRDGRCHGWKQVTDEARESPVRFLEHSPLDEVAEALRSQSRGSQRVLEVYSPSILKLVRSLVFPTSTSSVPPPGPRGRGSGHRPVYLEFLIVSVLVTLGRQSSCRVGL